MSSFFRSLARTSHKVSTYSGDLNALQKGGIPRLAKRIARRSLTRTIFSRLGIGR